jgi:hypothetical protein
VYNVFEEKYSANSCKLFSEVVFFFMQFFLSKLPVFKVRAVFYAKLQDLLLEKKVNLLVNIIK